MGSGGENETAFWRAEAERLAVDYERLVARDAAHQARVFDLEAQVAALREKVAALAKLAFGEKSEKVEFRTLRRSVRCSTSHESAVPMPLG